MLFGLTNVFHILWPVISIGTSLYLVLMEIAYVKTGDVRYYHQMRFWIKIFLLSFGLGVASGIPLQFEFGTNWAAFSKSAGDFFGNILGFEATMAFALEAAFLGIFVFGWKRVSKSLHLFSNVMVFVGATLSAFWIMAANSWMQIPRGVVMKSGTIQVTNYIAALFNPDTLVSFAHMWVACVESTAFLMAGICAWHLLRKQTSEQRAAFFLTSFKWLLVIMLVMTPLQVVLGDASARTVSRYQPAKAAAMELHWQTNPPGTGAPWALVAWPGNGSNAFQIEVPYMLSVLTNHTLVSQVQGLDTIPVQDRPPSVAIFYSFRIMVAIGMLMVALMLWGLIRWRRGGLEVATYRRDRAFWRIFWWSLPLGFIATELGWMVREIGRQPWIVTGFIRTADGVSPHLSGTTALVLLISFATIYIVLLALFIRFTSRIVRAGPKLTEKPPIHHRWAGS